MKTILLTGFDPFDGETVNPAWEAVRALDGVHIAQHWRIVAQRLPCEFGSVLPLLESAIERLQPDVVIAVGQAGGRAEISLERVAINVIDARIPDNANVQPVDVPVVADGPAAYFTSLPIKAMLVALRAAGMPATVSQTAGTFVCNHVFYGLMHAAAQRPALRRAGFVHIPYLPAQAVRHPGAPSMALESIIAAMTVLAESACTGATDVRVGAGATH